MISSPCERVSQRATELAASNHHLNNILRFVFLRCKCLAQ
jgi:hypothetical protein